MSIGHMWMQRGSTARRARRLLSIACLVVASAQVANASADQSGAVATAVRPAGGIVFTRGVYNSDDTARSGSLFRVDAGGGAVVRLTPSSDDIFDGSPAWGPDGRRIVFSRYDAGVRSYQIHVIPREGGRSRRITSGDGRYESPSWGAQRNLIAFVSSRDGQGDCLSLVAPDGQGQLELFCPPDGPDGQKSSLDKPVWSADGNNLFVQAGYHEGQLEYQWHSFAYKVAVDTGTATLLTDQVLDDFLPLAFAPDGSHGIYHGANLSSKAMLKVDFATDEPVSLGEGYAPVYSGDGSRIVFTRRTLTDAPPYEYINCLFVMNADGSNLRRLTSERGDSVAYHAQAWSGDGTRVLFNRTVWEPDEVTGTTSMRIIDVGTGAVTQLPLGAASSGSWHEGGAGR